MPSVVCRLRQPNLSTSLKKFSFDVKKQFGKRWCSKYFITTPIFYVNAAPHIGHLYTATIADAANRFQKLKNPSLKTKLMVGTDEHGLKVSQSADDLKIGVKNFCDQMSDKYRLMFQQFDIGYDDFIRTTEERHEKAAVALWNKIFLKDLIYGGTYSGWYCLADEVFVAEKYLNPKAEKDGIRFTLGGNKPVEFIVEFNYKFKLSSFRDDLLHWLKGDVIKPRLFQESVIRSIEEEKVLSDISVSRPTSRVPWGIPVPDDPTQTIYVWMDALSSYLCANGYPDSNFKWPPDVQIIGKDILKFHCIFWPAFLIAADLEPPKCIFCHSHWLINHEKMSKSKGNVVDPFKSIPKYTSDGLRFFLLREGVPHSDGNFSESRLTEYLNAALADSLGNLLSRCTAPAVNPSQIFPALFEGYRLHFDQVCDDLIKAIQDLPEEVSNHFNELNFYKGINAIVKVLHSANKFFQIRAPWNRNNNADHVKVSLHFAMEALRVCGILLQPIIPSTSDKLLNKLSIPKGKRSLKNIRPYSWEVPNISESQNWELDSGNIRLFQKIKAR